MGNYIIPIYLTVLFFLVLIGLFIIYNMLRFRYKGDKTVLVIIIMSAIFCVNVVFTLGILQDQPIENPQVNIK